MDAPSYDQLVLENQQLRLLVDQLQQTIRDLQGRVAELERTAKRQAAPFSKNKPKDRPKKPGRKKGKQHGEHAHRDKPQAVDETFEADLPKQCPDCGGDITDDPERLDQQFQTDVPRRPITRQFNIHCGHCAQCGKRVRGRHPLQTSDATGAAQSQLGADAQAAIIDLNKRAGMSFGKIADTFHNVFGIPITRGACAQIVLRGSRKLQPVYEQIQERIQSSEHLTPDETGWRIGGRPVWLHGWVGDEGATLFAIDPQRSADVLQKIIGLDWSGSMTHDGFSSYDRFKNVLHQQCADHALRRARGLLDKHVGAATIFPRQVIELFLAALRHRDRLNDADAATPTRVRLYECFTDRLLAMTRSARHNEENERFAKHLHHHAPSWFVFLLDEDIPATNHRAEQALRTPIVNRKVWGGNRTEPGAHAQAVLSSVLQTCKNNAINAFTFISNACRSVFRDLFS